MSNYVLYRLKCVLTSNIKKNQKRSPVLVGVSGDVFVGEFLVVLTSCQVMGEFSLFVPLSLSLSLPFSL